MRSEHFRRFVRGVRRFVRGATPPRLVRKSVHTLIHGLLILALMTMGLTSATSARTAATAPLSLRVQGNALVGADGTQVRLIGVDYSGTEYACVQDAGIFDGPSDSTAVSGLQSWNVRSVRIPLNEDCWLGINGIDPRYSGANYRNAIVSFVNLLHARGLYAELSLIWGAPGTYPATYQSGGPDEDHSPAMWASLAETFKSDRGVVLAPWGETITDWPCFLHGCGTEATYGPLNTPYATAGMQQAVDVMRGAGYKGVIAIPCIEFANDCADANGNWSQYEPVDPLHQLTAEAHVYGNNACGAQNGGACLDRTMDKLSETVPLLLGEVGETYDDSECGSSNIRVILDWADARKVSYEAWTWNTWGTCLALISNFDGTPNTTMPPGAAYASFVRSRMLSVATPLRTDDLGCCLATGSGVGASSWGAGRIDVIIRGTDNRVYHSFYANAWSSYESLGGVTLDTPATISWGPGRLDVFVRGTDNQLWHKWYAGGWSGWEPLGGVLTSGAAATTWGPGRLDVFVRGTDNQLWHKWYAGGWSGWEPLGGMLTGQPGAAAWSAGRIDVAVQGTGGSVYHKLYNGTWSGFEFLGGSLTGSPSVASESDGRLTVVGEDSRDRALEENTFEAATGRWSGWTAQGVALSSPPGAVSWGPGRLDVFWTGSDAHLDHAWSG